MSDATLRPPSISRDGLLTLMSLATCAIPFFCSKIPPMTDVTQHVLVASIINGIHDPHLGFQNYFSIDWAFAPGALAYVVLAALQKIVGPFNDARIYLTIWILGVWSGMWCLAKAKNHENPWLPALASLPIAYCWYVYMGFLPFLMTLPLFLFAIAAWKSSHSPIIRIFSIWLLSILLFGFHVVGVCAMAAAVGTMTVTQVVKGEMRWTQLIVAGAALAPTPILLGWYLLGDNPPAATLEYANPLSNAFEVIKFTAASLNSGAAVLLLVWISAIGLMTVFAWRRLNVHLDIVLAAALLGSLSILLPSYLGALWPAGPRLFLFALLLILVPLPLPRGSTRWLPISLSGLLVGLCAFTVIHMRSLDREFRDFLSGVELMQPGHRFLPILIDPSEGSRWVDPFWSLGSAYTVYKGGSNPYIFANPYIKTGASPLSYQQPETRQFAFLYEKEIVPHHYLGVSDHYDYVLVWGEHAELLRTLASEMQILKRQGKATFFTRIDMAKPEISHN